MNRSFEVINNDESRPADKYTAFTVDVDMNGRRTVYCDPLHEGDGAEFDFLFPKLLTCGQYDSCAVSAADVDTMFILASVCAYRMHANDDFFLKEIYWIRSRDQTLDMRSLFRTLYAKACPNVEMSFATFLHCLSFLHVPFSTFLSFCMNHY